jgi:hypothetical protein
MPQLLVIAQRTFAAGSPDSDNESGEHVKPSERADHLQEDLWESGCSNYELDGTFAGNMDRLLLD